MPRQEARKTALAHLIKTYFDDSVEKVVSAILETRGENLTEDESSDLSRLIDEFLKGGKG